MKETLGREVAYVFTVVLMSCVLTCAIAGTIAFTRWVL